MEDFVDAFLLSSLERGALWAFRLWIPSSSFIVLGRFSKKDEEVKSDSKLPIRRRLGGGCAVVLYPGTIVLSVAVKRSLNPSAFPRQWIAFFNGVVVSVLNSLGIKGVRERGWGDIVCDRDNRKVGGVSLYSTKEAILYQLSLIYYLDSSIISDNLKHPPREPDYRKGRSHSDFLTSIRATAPEVSAGELAHCLEIELRTALKNLSSIL